MLDILLKFGQNDKKIMNLAQQLAIPGHYSANVNSLARPFFIALLKKQTSRPILIVGKDGQGAEKTAFEISNYSPAFFLPKLNENESPDIRSRRIIALDALSKTKNILCLGVETLKDKQPAPSQLDKPLAIKIGQRVNLHNLAKKLVKIGYENQYQVELPAQFSIRGNICDIFPVDQEYPVRLEFFGDKVEAINYFSFLDQRSREKLKEISIISCSVYEENIVGLENYLKPETIIIFIDKGLIEKNLYSLPLDPPWRVLDGGGLGGGEKYNHPPLNPLPSRPCQGGSREGKSTLKYLETTLDLTTIDIKSHQQPMGFEELPFSAGQFEKMAAFLKEKQKQGYLTVLNIKEEGKRARLKEMLANWRLFNEDLRLNLALITPLILVTGYQINNSFIWPSAKLAVISDQDIFVRQLQKLPAKFISSQVRISSFEDLKIGDFVVHINHGIARYEGLEAKKIDNIKREYLKLAYAEGDKLFVPVTEMDRVSRYIGSDNKEPPLTRLSSNRWMLTKKRVKNSVRKLAINLLSLYAKRSQTKGFSFSADTPWQKQLEDDFPFEETRGQISTIEQVKEDMQKEQPMDRLICGDVGYGKTEVALRAAFKAVQDGKQVLFLVPTTILAQQHFSNFTARLSPYPVILKMLSRFKTKAEQQSIVKDFNRGKVDILIGTHRLLQKDVQPNNLGLVVVDEEQRFGVSHKEKLKAFKTNIDVISLSATPIPRTLQMALSGIRNLSIIETAPNNRHPVMTHVGPYDLEMVAEAVKKELARGGQVFYLYNDVRTIDSIAQKLKLLVPQGRVAIAHGQLKERQLEKTMLDFLDGKFNVLVTTTIIESGIDVASANTLIVDKAEMFGLAQLYQIRGRVGRSSQQAFAYLFYRAYCPPAGRTGQAGRGHLTHTALERLQTLADYTSLGSGYKIALRDLEIRGAGNLLGAEQSGHIADVGFDLYTTLLQSAVDELRGVKPAAKPSERDLPLSAYIPKTYIGEESLRIDFYQRLAAATTKESFIEVLKEMAERFGSLPAEVKNLRSIGILKFQTS